MRKVLLTTYNDLSVNYFRNWEIYYYEDQPKFDKHQRVDVLYARDPFNRPDFTPEEDAIDEILGSFVAKKYVDSATSYAQMKVIEDKWKQCLVFGGLMPKTWLACEKVFVDGEHICKPRISQRAKNILFTQQECQEKKVDKHWVIQKRMDIVQEHRVYAVGGKVVKQGSVKSSKQTGQVKIQELYRLEKSEIEFMKQVLVCCKQLDFIGADVAVLADGSYKLIEVNRSPQFRRYMELGGQDLVKLLEVALNKQ